MIQAKRAISSRKKVRYLFDKPDYGTVTEVQDGIFWLRLPLPFALDHVNVWLLDDGDGWTIIDTGYGNQACRDVWQDKLSGFLRSRPIHRLIATHFHPDHVGLLGWLAERCDAEVMMARKEWLTARMLALDSTDDFSMVGERQDRRAGLPEEMIEARRQRGNMFRHAVSLPPPAISLLGEGDTIAMGGSLWRVMIGEGHAPEQLTFYSAERKILIAADHILPRISPIIGVSASTPRADPLSDYQRTLPHFKAVAEDALVLPSHDSPFEGLHGRIDQLLDHHDDRLAQTIDACSQPRTAAEVIPVLFKRELDLHQIGFALAETLAHINHLVAKSKLAYEADSTGAWRYRTA